MADTEHTVTRTRCGCGKCIDCEFGDGMKVSVTERITSHVKVSGRCPACHGTHLFVGHGGHVTCSWAECPDPCAADKLLRRGLLA